MSLLSSVFLDVPMIRILAVCSVRDANSSLGVHEPPADLLSGSSGKRYILEGNAVPGWRGVASLSGMDIAPMVTALLGLGLSRCDGRLEYT
jgi:hypothetical protein